MTQTQLAAKHFRDLHFGGNWTTVSLKDALKDLTWYDATRKVGSLNTIAALVYHINYYVKALQDVLQGNPFTANDKFSFDVPEILSHDDWNTFIEQVFNDAEYTSKLIETLPDDILTEDFVQSKYGSYYRNIHGIIEHGHYHLGQIIIIKRLIRESSN